MHVTRKPVPPDAVPPLIREYRREDAQGVTDLLNEAEVAAGGHPSMLAANVQSLVDACVSDISRDTRLVFEDDALVAVAMVATPPVGGYRVDLCGGVRQDRLGRGTGRELLAWQLVRAAEIHRATAPDALWQAEAEALAEDTARIRLLDRFGFKPARYFFEMVADTDRRPSTALPPGLRATAYRPGRAEALHAAHCEAFRDHWGYAPRPFESWVGLTVGQETFLPELSRIALNGDEIAGYVLAHHDPDPERVYIAHVGTRRAWRRRGVASALLGEVLAAARSAGFKTAALGVDADSPTGAVGVYERVGFQVGTKAVAYHKPLT